MIFDEQYEAFGGDAQEFTVTGAANKSAILTPGHWYVVMAEASVYWDTGGSTVVALGDGTCPRLPKDQESQPFVAVAGTRDYVSAIAADGSSSIVVQVIRVR